MQPGKQTFREIGILGFLFLIGMFGVNFSVHSQSQPPSVISDDFSYQKKQDFLAALADAQVRGTTPQEVEKSILPTIDITELSNFKALNSPIEALENTSQAPFPHPALYGGPNSSGWPMVGVLSNQRPGPTEPLNEDVMNAYARFPHVILPATPLADSRPDILTSLRVRNPNIHAHAYVMGSTTWCPDDGNGNIAYAPGIYYRDYYLAVTNGDPTCASASNGFLWMQDGIKADQPPHTLGINANLAHRIQNPDNTYTYDVAERIANAMYEYGRAGRNWDGIFIDVYCPGIMWLETPGHLFDYARAGFGNDNSDPANRDAFDQAWQAGHQRIATRLRELAIADGHPDYPISGNCAQAPSRLHPYLNGWMRENYPYQNGGTFFSNLFAWPWGFIHQDYYFRSPTYNYIFTAPNWSGGLTNNPNDEQYNVTNQRKMRFGLGSASLGNGWSAFHEGSGNPANGYWFNWWYDEYGVNTMVPQSDQNWGRAMKGAAYGGWLGQPLDNVTQMISSSSSPDLLSTNQGFETVGVTPTSLTDWFYGANGGAQITATRDTSTSVIGSASAKIHISQLGEVPGNISFSPLETFSISAYQQYSITFWAKASSVRPIDILMFSNPWPAQSIQLTTEWKQYQIQIQVTQTANNAYVLFTLGHELGDVWFDDVHVQAGTSSVYRRDFERGIVLVNAGSAAQTVTLEKPYKKILGTVNPALNDGSIVTSVTIPGTGTGAGTGDALFLLTIDETPPNGVTDLAAGGT